MSEAQASIESVVRFQRFCHGHHARRSAEWPLDGGRIPLVARWLALAHRIEALVSAGAVANYAEVARLGHVSRARVSQIMILLFLAPDIQEAVLFLPPVKRGPDPLPLHQLQSIARTPSWRCQRALWRDLQHSMTTQS